MGLIYYNGGLLFRKEYGGLASTLDCCCKEEEAELIHTPCCPEGIPANLIFEFQECTGRAACLNGLSYPITYNPDSVQWNTGGGVAPAYVPGCYPGTSFSIAFSCNGGTWSLGLGMPTLPNLGCIGGIDLAASQRCDPFLVEGSGLWGPGGNQLPGGANCVDNGDKVGWKVYSA